MTGIKIKQKNSTPRTILLIRGVWCAVGRGLLLFGLEGVERFDLIGLDQVDESLLGDEADLEAVGLLQVVDAAEETVAEGAIGHDDLTGKRVLADVLLALEGAHHRLVAVRRLRADLLAVVGDVAREQVFAAALAVAAILLCHDHSPWF